MKRAKVRKLKTAGAGPMKNTSGSEPLYSNSVESGVRSRGTCGHVLMHRLVATLKNTFVSLESTGVRAMSKSSRSSRPEVSHVFQIVFLNRKNPLLQHPSHKRVILHKMVTLARRSRIAN